MGCILAGCPAKTPFMHDFAGGKVKSCTTEIENNTTFLHAVLRSYSMHGDVTEPQELLIIFFLLY